MMAASAADTRKKRMKSAAYGDVVIGQFDDLRHNDQLCDFTVKAGGKSIRVTHSIVTQCDFILKRHNCGWESDYKWVVRKAKTMYTKPGLD